MNALGLNTWKQEQEMPK